MKRILICITVTVLLGLSKPAHATVTGQWDFNSGGYAATVGSDLVPWGVAASGTEFGTTTALGVPNIGGEVAQVMKFPAMPTSADGYQMFPGAPANGSYSAGDVNHYSLLMDVLYPAASDNVYRALFQTANLNNNDADFFIGGGTTSPDPNGLGISGVYNGTILPDTWYRIALVVDLDTPAGTPTYYKYINGTLVGSQELRAARFAPYSKESGEPSWIFSDNDGETAAGYVNSIQFRDNVMTTEEIAALGGPSAAGIPIPVITNVTVTVTPTNQDSVVVVGMAATPYTASADGPGNLSYQWYRNGVAVSGQTNPSLVLSNVQSSDAGSYTMIVNNGTQFATSAPPSVVTVEGAGPTIVTGQWDFNQGDLRATVGQPLQYFDATVQTDTSFGTTTSFGVSDIDGQPASVMFCNPSVIGITNWGGFVMTHGMAPNGGGTNVNQYTVILDLYYINWTSGFYRALWQTTPQNTNDADAFVSPGNGLGISQQYDGELILDNWHRIVLTYDLTRREFGKYIDGTNVLAAPTGDAPRGPHHVQYLDNDPDPTAGGFVDMRWSLGPTALLLADGGIDDGIDGEVQPVYVSSVQVRSGRMTDAAIAALGTPTANKIPQPPASIQARRSGTSIVIDWTGTVLERAVSVTGGWSEVTGAAHPYVITSPTGVEFFRVK